MAALQTNVDTIKKDLNHIDFSTGCIGRYKKSLKTQSDH